MLITGISMLVSSIVGFIMFGSIIGDRVSSLPNNVFDVLMAFFLLDFGIGLLLTIIGYVKSRNANALNQLINTQNSINGKSVCKKCGLNISQDCIICPRCGAKIEK